MTEGDIIYIRQNFEQKYFQYVKIGSCKCPVSRDYSYKTNEVIKRGIYKIYKIKNIPSGMTIQNIEIDMIHKTLKNRNLHIFDAQGTEIFKEESINHIEDILTQNGLDYHIISDKEYEEMKKEYDSRNRNITNNIEEREYQNKAVEKWKLNHGILCHATGLGKSTTCCKMIRKYLKQFPEHKVLYHTKSKDIIITVKEDFSKNGINDISYYDNKNKKLEHNIAVTNSAQLENILKVYQPNLIITDECHDITANDVYGILKDQKEKGVIQLGLSATPLKRRSSKSIKRIKEIYNNNYIDIIDLVEGIDKGHLIPFDIIWTKQEKILDTIREDDKTICWSDTIEHADEWYERIKDKMGSDYVFLSHSKNDPNCDKIRKFISEDTKKGVLICVGRFKQGTNDPKLSTGIRLDNFKKSAEHVRIQKLGRLLRKCLEINKRRARFITFISDEDDELEIINYWYELGLTDDKYNIKYNREKNKVEVTPKDKPEKILMTFSSYEKKINFSKIIKRYRSTNSEEKYFNYLKRCNKEDNIKDPQEYKMSEHYEEELEEKFKSLWKGWYDFLGIDTDKYPDTKEDFLAKCKEKNVIYIDDEEAFLDKCKKNNLPYFELYDLYKDDDFKTLHKLFYEPTRRSQ